MGVPLLPASVIAAAVQTPELLLTGLRLALLLRLLSRAGRGLKVNCCCRRCCSCCCCSTCGAVFRSLCVGLAPAFAAADPAQRRRRSAGGYAAGVAAVAGGPP